ncbi:MAG: phosphomethylpyrimidine synthase ThiC, partial [Cyanobacteria bacterium J06649_11]
FYSWALQNLDIPIGLIPTYEIYYQIKKNGTKDIKGLTLRTFEKYAIEGIDFFSIHSSINREIATRIQNSNRVIPITSRGGVMLMELMYGLNIENPLYEYLEEILDICSAYNITLSLINSSRAGSVVDAFDDIELLEFKNQRDINLAAERKEVQTIIELLNHVPLNRIPEFMQFGLDMFNGYPLGGLGPLPTDIAVGYDDVAGAIGASTAFMYGLSWVNCITAGEHTYLPKREDTFEAIKKFSIAAHIGYTARMNDFERDCKLSQARRINDWQSMKKHSIFPESAERLFLENGYKKGQACSMCDKECPLVRNVSLNKKYGC